MEWRFFHDDTDKWTWQRVDAVNLHPPRSSNHKSFGSALSDAMRRGFIPSRHIWVVEDYCSITRFALGEPPQIVKK